MNGVSCKPSRVGHGLPDVLRFEFRILLDNLGRRHPVGDDEVDDQRSLSRIPRMQARPPITRGLNVMWSKPLTVSVSVPSSMAGDLHEPL